MYGFNQQFEPCYAELLHKCIQTRIYHSRSRFLDVESDTENDMNDNVQEATPRSKDQTYVISTIRKSYKATKGPPHTDLSFYRIGR